MIKDRVRAVALISGGLDSTLSAAIVDREGVEVLGINFNTGFCLFEHKRWMGKKRKDGTPYILPALYSGAILRISVEIIDIRDEYMKIVTNPTFGYGKVLNPCIDCKVLMLKKAKEYMNEMGANFLVTGEVLGQRPMTQTSRALKLIDRVAGVKGLVLRPLSAKLLSVTHAERMGWVKRDALYDIKGRSRKVQFELARTFGIEDYPQPSGGGCFLTDRNYARRLNDLFKFKGRGGVHYKDILSLKIGRHFRLSKDSKLILSRDEEEGKFILQNLGELGMTLHASGTEGTIGLLTGEDVEVMRLAARIALRYIKSNGPILFLKDGDLVQKIDETPMPRLEVLDYLIN